MKIFHNCQLLFPTIKYMMNNMEVYMIKYKVKDNKTIAYFDSNGDSDLYT